MTDAKTLAYINLFAVLGSLENLCALDPAAGALLRSRKPLRLGIAVKGGPAATFAFADGACTMEEGAARCDIRLPFSSCEKFNGMIDGTVTPIPSKGFTHIGFLTKDFTALTNLLTRYLKASPEDLADETFFRISTSLMFYTIAAAISQIGNHDRSGRFSASNLMDGTVMLSIKGGPAAAVTVTDHTLRTVKERPREPRAIMEFADMRLARDLFEGKVNSFACIGTRRIEMRGMISMIDNINRMLDRVAQYLA